MLLLAGCDTTYIIDAISETTNESLSVETTQTTPDNTDSTEESWHLEYSSDEESEDESTSTTAESENAEDTSTENIPVQCSHAWNPADCDTPKTCSKCGDTEGTALGHDEQNHAAKAPTCTQIGWNAYVTCSRCSYSTYPQQIIKANGHNWAEATTTAPKTCQTCGTTEGDKLPSSPGAEYAETLYVNYIDVGQGDSIFIKVGDCDILIDAGQPDYGNTVCNYLESQNVDDIELMINTHPDSDHYGGLTQVLNEYTVEEIWVSSYNKSNTFYTAVANKGLTKKTPAVGSVFTYEYLTLTVLHSGAEALNSNDSSIVVMVEYGSFKFLFTGDISTTVESQLVSSGQDLSCDVLKVAHHGSKYSSSAEFLSATGTKYGVICVGTNSYGHPTSQALERLTSAGITQYTTQSNGDVVFSTNGATLTLPDGTIDTSKLNIR